MVFTRYLVLADHLHNWPHYDLGFGAPSIDALHHRRRLCRSCQLTAIMIINGIVIIWIKSTSLKDSTIVIVLLALLHHHFCISFSFVLRRLHPLIGCCPRKPLTLPPCILLQLSPETLSMLNPPTGIAFLESWLPLFVLFTAFQAPVVYTIRQ